MNFKYIALLVLSIIVNTTQTGQKPEIVSSDTNHNSEISFVSQPKRHVSAYERHDFLNINQRMPGYDPIPSAHVHLAY